APRFLLCVATIGPSASLIVISNVALAFGRPLGIEGDADRLIAGIFRAPQPIFCHFSISKGIQLKPEMSRCGLGQFFKWNVRIGADGEDRPAGRGRSVRGAFPFGMSSFMTAARRN